MSRSATEQAMLAWVKAALPALTVIYEQQSGPRPNGNYATVMLASEQGKSGTIDVETSTTPGTVDTTKFVEYRRKQKQATVRVNIYADNPLDKVHTLELSVRDATIKQLLTTASVSVVQPLAVIGGESEARDTTWERRAIAEFQVRFRIEATAEVADIKTTVLSVTEG